MEKFTGKYDGRNVFTQYTYDAAGNMLTVRNERGYATAYTYDGLNRVETITDAKSNQYRYAYDQSGNKLSDGYTYDKAGRILKVITPGKTTVYAYDNAGNRVSHNETYTSLQPSGYVDEATGKDIQYILKKSDYTYSSSNTLLKLTERMFDESNTEIARKTTKYVYDNNGNQLRQTVSYVLPDNTKLRPASKGTAYGDNIPGTIDKLVEKTSYTYDGFNRLKKAETVKEGVRTTAEYTYNGDDLRVSKTVKKSNTGYQAEVTKYLYDRQNVILETDGSNNIKARYVKGINYISKTDASNKEANFLFNGHGDVVQTVDEAGTILNQYDYDIWGNPVLTIETVENAIRYAGEYLDTETGLYYLRARYYDPYIGRFITEDSHWGEDKNPLSLNLYTYCFNDPLRYTDPTGNWPKFLDDFFNDLREKAAEALKAAKKLAEEVAAKAKALLLKAEAEALKAKLKAEEEIKKKADDDKKKADEDAKKKAAEEVKKEEAKKSKLKAEEDARKAKDNPLTKLMKDIFEKATKSAEQAKKAAIDSAKQSDSGKNVTLSSVVKNYRQGVKDAIKSTFEGVANTVAHPIKTVQNIGTFLSGFDSHGIPNARGIQMSTSVGLSAQGVYNDFINGDANLKSRYIGRAVGEIGLTIAGTKGVDEVVKGIRVADKVGEVANVINKADNVIEGTSSTIPKVASTESKWLQQFASTGASEAGNVSKTVGRDVTDYKGTFFEQHPDLEGKVVVHHSVEQQVLRKYPNVFTEKEIHGYERLRGIPNEINNEVHLSKIRKEWNQFYKDIAKGKIQPTKENFLNKANEIDDMFGNQFNPQIR